MNIPIAPWRVLKGEHAKRVERKQAQRRQDIATCVAWVVGALILWMAL